MHKLTNLSRTVWISDVEGDEGMKNCSAPIFGTSGTGVEIN